MPLNHDILVPDLMARYSVTLPANAIAWRATLTDEGRPPTGWLKGLDLPVRMILTDGVVAWFLLGNDRLFYGHFQNFEPDKPEAKEKKKSKRMLALEAD